MKSIYDVDSVLDLLKPPIPIVQKAVLLVQNAPLLLSHPILPPCPSLSPVPQTPLLLFHHPMISSKKEDLATKQVDAILRKDTNTLPPLHVAALVWLHANGHEEQHLVILEQDVIMILWCDVGCVLSMSSNNAAGVSLRAL